MDRPLLATLLCVFVAAPLWVAAAGVDGPDSTESPSSIVGRLIVVGDPPPPEPVDPGRDACCQAAAPTDQSVVVGPEGGLANVLVSVETRRGEAEPPLLEPPSEPATLSNRDCAFEPRVLLARVGSPLVLVNADPTMHNVNASFLRNRALNLVIEPEGRREIALERTERKPAEVRCNVHRFMRAWVHVSDHGYAAVTDETGRFELPPLPPGTWRLRFWREGSPMEGLQVPGGVTDRRGEVAIAVTDERLDLGDLPVPADRLR